MSYSVSMALRASKGLADLPDPAYEKVKEAIEGLSKTRNRLVAKNL